jgi:uncharacterized peroxidase-related enzyme
MKRGDAGAPKDAAARDAWIEAIKSDWQKAVLPAADRALCEFAMKLTAAPGAMARTDVETMRAGGFDDRAIHDAAQAIAYFNYINRVADALGVGRE